MIIRQDVLLCIIDDKELRENVVKTLAEKDIFFYSKWQSASIIGRVFRKQQDTMFIYVYSAQQKEAEVIAKRLGALHDDGVKKQSENSALTAIRYFMNRMKVIVENAGM